MTTQTQARVRTLLLEVTQRADVIADVREILHSLLDQAQTLLGMIEDVSRTVETSEGHRLGWEQRVQSYWDRSEQILDGLSRSISQLGDSEQERRTMDSITKVREMIKSIVDALFALLRGEDMLRG